VSKNYLSEIFQDGTKQLKNAHISKPEREGLILLQKALNTQTYPLLLDPQTKLTSEQINSFYEYINRRKNLEPIAYIIGQIKFFDLIINVDSSVLIPRPETEQFVELIFETLKHKPNYKKLAIAEVGTGSGAIALSLIKKLSIKLTASDISENALKIANKNAKLNNLEESIKIEKSDLLQSYEDNSIDILIANLPYIPTHWLSKLDPDVKDFEPDLALDGGPDGLHLIDKLLKQAKTKLKPNGMIFLEIWHEHNENLKKIVLQSFPDSQTKILKDFAELNRFAVVQT
jgi:release factor glutamine methyltransferase